MKAILIACAGALLFSCSKDPQEEVVPQAEKVTYDNRIGQGTMTYTSSRKEGTTISFVAESYTRANYVFNFVQTTKEGGRNIVGEYSTKRMGYGDSISFTLPFYIAPHAELEVLEFYQDQHVSPVFLGTFPVERVKKKNIEMF